MRTLLIAVVKAYRLLLSPWLGAGCRFEPTCSLYAIEALHTHGSARGSVLTAWRIVRCGPWCAGGHDPVPTVAPSGRLFTRLIPQQRALPSSAMPTTDPNAP